MLPSCSTIFVSIFIELPKCCRHQCTATTRFTRKIQHRQRFPLPPWPPCHPSQSLKNKRPYISQLRSLRKLQTYSFAGLPRSQPKNLAGKCQGPPGNIKIPPRVRGHSSQTERPTRCSTHLSTLWSV